MTRKKAKSIMDGLAAGMAVGVGIPGGYDAPRDLMGNEALCIAYYDRPELIHDILGTIGDAAVKVLDVFLDAGINHMFPMEPAAEMDIVEIREQYGTRLAFMGGIDKHVLRRSKEEIVAELEYKIPPMVATGACVLGLDHRIPNGTPLANYRFHIDKAWQIMNEL